MSQEDEKKPSENDKAPFGAEARGYRELSPCFKLPEQITEPFSTVSQTSIQKTFQDKIPGTRGGTSGPIQIIEEALSGISSESDLNHPPRGPQRRYECCNYETCLKIAAALNWDSFSCHGCCGETSEHLLWRAQHAVQKDKTARAICNLPDPRNRKIENITEPFRLRRVSGESGES